MLRKYLITALDKIPEMLMILLGATTNLVTYTGKPTRVAYCANVMSSIFFGVIAWLIFGFRDDISKNMACALIGLSAFFSKSVRRTFEKILVKYIDKNWKGHD